MLFFRVKFSSKNIMIISGRQAGDGNFQLDTAETVSMAWRYSLAEARRRRVPVNQAWAFVFSRIQDQRNLTTDECDWLGALVLGSRHKLLSVHEG